MPHQIFSLPAAAAYLQLPQEELKHLVKQDAVPHHKRGSGVFFVNKEITEWASRRILTLHGRPLAEQNKQMIPQGRLSDFCKPQWCADFAPRTAKGALRDIAALAGKTELLYDESDLFRQLAEREEQASTALAGGAALLHPANHDPYLIAESFFLFARSQSSVFFGAPDNNPTRLFFLLCFQEVPRHLRVLARLCRILQDSDVAERMLTAETPAEAFRLLIEEENKSFPLVENGQ